MSIEQDNDIADFLAAFSDDEDVRRLMYDCAGRLLAKLKNQKRNWREAGLAVDLKHVADWIGVALLHGEEWLSKTDEHGRPRKLLKFGDLEGLLKEANKAMVRRAMQTPVIKIEEGEEAVEYTFPDGWYMARLLTPAALDNESAAMQHCVGHGTYDRDVKNGTVVILSLRDPHNKPHVTVEIAAKTNSVSQIRGKQNERPRFDYARRIRQFIADRDFDSVYRPIEVGIIVDDMGHHHGIDSLPAGLSVKGNLDLKGYELERLPELLEVRGDLDIQASGIRELPRGLRVTGNLLAKGSKLEKLPVNHGIARSIDISETRVTSLPEGLFVDGDLDISETLLDALPEGLVVTGHLKAVSTSMAAFPEGVLVGRNIDLCGSAIRGFEARSLYVGGSLLMNNCGRVRLPDILSVENALFLEGTEVTSGARILEVGSNLYCKGGNFGPGSRRMRVGGRVVHARGAKPHELERQDGEPQYARTFGVRD